MADADLCENKPVCKYGKKCYRRNAKHLDEYFHPGDETQKNEEPPRKKSKLQKDSAPKKTTKAQKGSATTKKKIGDYFKGGGKTSTSTKTKTEETEKEVEEESVEPIGDVKENIRSKFLVDMPDDFYEFWEFAKSISPNNPSEAFKDTLGLYLVGPFDVLAGKCKKTKDGETPCYLTHWRYYYDPPEFLTVLRGDDLSQFHLGYFRDDPKEAPVFVACNTAKESCIITPRGENLFAAICWYIDEKLKKDKASQEVNNTLRYDVVVWARRKGYPLELKTNRMKAREQKSVCATFHKAGLVVPVDENEVGYREVPETPGKLKRMFKKIVESKTEDERNKNFDPLMELIMLIQFANDECDYGEGLELGMDLFSYGYEVFHKTILNLLPLAYNLLGRPEFAQIIQAHLKNRKDTVDLSVI